MGKKDWEIYDKLFPHAYPYPSGNRDLYKRLDIDTLVISKRFLDPSYLERNNLSKLLNNGDYEYDVGKVVYESDTFVIRKL